MLAALVLSGCHDEDVPISCASTEALSDGQAKLAVTVSEAPMLDALDLYVEGDDHTVAYARLNNGDCDAFLLREGYYYIETEGEPESGSGACATPSEQALLVAGERLDVLLEPYCWGSFDP